MGKHAHYDFESRRDTLAPHASNAQGGLFLFLENTIPAFYSTGTNKNTSEVVQAI